MESSVDERGKKKSVIGIGKLYSHHVFSHLRWTAQLATKNHISRSNVTRDH